MYLGGGDAHYYKEGLSWMRYSSFLSMSLSISSLSTIRLHLFNNDIN